MAWSQWSSRMFRFSFIVWLLISAICYGQEVEVDDPSKSLSGTTSIEFSLDVKNPEQILTAQSVWIQITREYKKKEWKKLIKKAKKVDYPIPIITLSSKNEKALEWQAKLRDEGVQTQVILVPDHLYRKLIALSYEAAKKADAAKKS